LLFEAVASCVAVVVFEVAVTVFETEAPVLSFGLEAELAVEELAMADES